jgi:hypothetical protein
MCPKEEESPNPQNLQKPAFVETPAENKGIPLNVPNGQRNGWHRKT